MAYDPKGKGAEAGDVLVRRGKSWESAKRLGSQAALAEQAGAAVNGVCYGHGVSVTSPEANERLARDPQDAVSATRKQFEDAAFEVRYTPTRNDTDHHTVILPKPVTDEATTRLNTILGRIRKGP
jgi:hypothetical protein